MATEIDSMRSGVPGTVPFMAASLLRETSDRHSLVYDCESVFWICALSFLKSTAIGNFKDMICGIFSTTLELGYIASLKATIVDDLHASVKVLNDDIGHIGVNITTAEKRCIIASLISRGSFAKTTSHEVTIWQKIIRGVVSKPLRQQSKTLLD